MHRHLPSSLAFVSALSLSLLIQGGLLQPDAADAAAITCSSGLSGCHFNPSVTDGTGRNAPSGQFPGSHVKHSGAAANQYAYACTHCHPSGSYTNSHQTGYKNISGSSLPGTSYTQGKKILLSFQNNPTFGSCNTIYCHSTGQATNGTATPIYNPVAWGSTTGCGSCHLDFNSNASATGDHVKHAQGTANLSCATCHSGYTETSVTTATHVNKTIETSFSGTYATGTTYSQANQAVGNLYGNCTTSKCHGQGAPVWGGALYSATVPCENCHGSATGTFYSTAATGAAPTKTISANDTKVGAHTAHLTAGTISSPIACTECHPSVTGITTPATHMDGSSTFTWGTLATTGSLTPAIASGTCSNNYCHGAAMPGGDTTGTDETPLWTDTAYLSTTLDVATCGKCHGFPPLAASGHPAATAPSSFPTSNCNCHANMSTTGSTYANIFSDKTKHINGIYEPAASGCKGCHASGSAKDVQTEFAKNSHHTNKAWANITDADCVVCHAEGSIAAGSVSVVASRHGNDTGTKGVVDLYNADVRATIYSLTLTQLTGRNAAANTSFDTFCMSCHDSNGAAAVTTGNGFTGGNSATNPFNDTTITNAYDGVTRTFGAAPAALNVLDQFNTANYSHHAVRGARYTKTTGLAFGQSLTQANLLSTTVNNYSGGTGFSDISTLHCNDCHSTAYSSHGGSNEYMLQTATSENPSAEHTGASDYVCAKCHVNGAYDGTTGNHIGNASDLAHTSNLTTTGRVGSNGHISGIACLNCHDGAVGLGGIHGFPNATYVAGQAGSGQGTYNKRRFMPGSGLRWYDPSLTHTTSTINDDGTWGEATATNQCYTLGTATTSSGCTKHAKGTGQDNRNTRRPATY